jgi:hypothetical protein
LLLLSLSSCLGLLLDAVLQGCCGWQQLGKQLGKICSRDNTAATTSRVLIASASEHLHLR